MKGIQFILISKNAWQRLGLRHLLKGLNTSIQFEAYESLSNLDLANLPENLVLCLAHNILPEPPMPMLDKILGCNEAVKLILLAKNKHVDDRILAYFDAIITPKQPEPAISSAIEKLCADFEGSEQKASEDLSVREREILRCVALGQTNKEISENLNISAHTVITHRKNITAKLAIKTIAGLTVYAVLNGIISPDEVSG